MTDSLSVFAAINKVVSQIPKGKVATYKHIADIVHIKDYRLVGFALHRNRDPKKIPCHRVVKSDGSLAKGYAMGGIIKQKEMLVSEGIHFTKNGKINLPDYFWKGIKK